MTDKGFGAVHRCVIDQHIGFFVQLLTELIHTRHYDRRVHCPIDQVRHQRVVAFQQPSDIEPLMVR